VSADVLGLGDSITELLAALEGGAASLAEDSIDVRCAGKSGVGAPIFKLSPEGFGVDIVDALDSCEENMGRPLTLDIAGEAKL